MYGLSANVLPSACRAHAATFATVSLLLVAALAAGCVTDVETAPQLHLAAQWDDDPLFPDPHLELILWNDGTATANVGPGGSEVRVNGPVRVVPVDWAGATGRSVPPGDATTVWFHPVHDGGGGIALTIDHGNTDHASPPRGLYEVCVGDTCSKAPL